MKLKNKKTGEIRELPDGFFCGDNLKKICEEWEDYEEPKEHWAIDQFGEPINVSGLSRLQLEKLHRLGNDFPSENATMKAIEKLKAWKRLKEAGFIINRWNGNLGGGDHYDCCGQVNITAEVGDEDKRDTVKTDLDLLFGGEE